MIAVAYNIADVHDAGLETFSLVCAILHLTDGTLIGCQSESVWRMSQTVVAGRTPCRANGRDARFTSVRTRSRTGFQPVWGCRNARVVRSTAAAWGHAAPCGLDAARPSRNARLAASLCRTGIIAMRDFYDNSDSVVRRIYNVVLHLDGRNATICGQGGKRHV